MCCGLVLTKPPGSQKTLWWFSRCWNNDFCSVLKVLANKPHCVFTPDVYNPKVIQDNFLLWCCFLLVRCIVLRWWRCIFLPQIWAVSSQCCFIMHLNPRVRYLKICWYATKVSLDLSECGPLSPMPFVLFSWLLSLLTGNKNVHQMCKSSFSGEKEQSISWWQVKAFTCSLLDCRLV